jgi:hypothetical protein
MFNMSPFGDSTDVNPLNLAPATHVPTFERQWSICSFCDTQTTSFLEFSIPVSYCFVRWWFCTIFGSKTTFHCYNWLGFSKLQDTKSFLFTWKRHDCTPLPPSGETGNYAIASVTKKRLHFLYPLACFISYMWVCYCTAKPLNPGWTYETRCIKTPPVASSKIPTFSLLSHWKYSVHVREYL